MDFMFWVWLGVIVVMMIVEAVTTELVSVWFAFGAIIPFIMSATNSVRWEIQVAVFVVVSAILIVPLRRMTKKFLLKDSDEKTNAQSLVGQHYKMSERTDFEHMGSIKINDVTWSAVAENRETIESGQLVEIVRIEGNKLVVKMIDASNQTPDQPMTYQLNQEKAREKDNKKSGKKNKDK